MSGDSRVRIKICGITNVADATLVAELGADAIGLNFYAPSPRSVTVHSAQKILSRLPSTIDPIAVFVHEAPSAIAEQLVLLPGIKAVQWHAQVASFLVQTPFPIIPAFAVGDESDLHAIVHYLLEATARDIMPRSILLDAHIPGLYGGTGKTAPWELLADFRPGVPVMLAGGLTPDNVAEAIRLVKPFAVDVASGVEKAPGVKDPEMIRRFIEAVREAGD